LSIQFEITIDNITYVPANATQFYVRFIILVNCCIEVFPESFMAPLESFQVLT